MNGKKLFIVEFGKPDSGGWISMGSQSNLYVIASSYNEAAQKALFHAETNREKKSVLDSDGNLKLSDEEILSVKAVRLACENIVW